MKLAILSDLHGSLSAFDGVMAWLAPWQPDHLLLLGDLLNHGPRNPVPEGYQPAALAERPWPSGSTPWRAASWRYGATATRK